MAMTPHMSAKPAAADEGVATATMPKYASFLDLPGKLRNVIYELALRRSRRVRVGFKYDCETPDHLSVIEKPRHRKPFYSGIYRPLLRCEIGSVYWTQIEETVPILARAMPLLQQEILSIHYSENTFRIPLRNTLDRRLCAKWIRMRGPALRGLRHVRLQMPQVRPWNFGWSVELTLRDDGIVEEKINEWSSVRDCVCSVQQMVALRLSHQHATAFGGARDIDSGPLAGLILNICLAAELAERAWETQTPSVRDIYGPRAWTLPWQDCQSCGKKAVYVL
ncbi:hypothetical protein LTR85_003628 [Meristemomyces frigidus]|nr:hypothetical protein LTR85_003628 [Meristemomyces frigidus]